MVRAFSMVEPNVFETGGRDGISSLGFDVFGFEGFGQAPDPIAELNAVLIPRAKDKLKEYALYKQIIPRLDKENREKAEDIIKDLWYPPPLLGIFPRGKYNLEQLAAKVQRYVNEGYIAYLNEDLERSSHREKRYKGFRRGLHDLRDLMKPFRNLFNPTVIKEIQRITVTEERTTEALLARAEKLATRARTTRAAIDIAIARAMAEEAKDSAELEKKPNLAVRADAIISEMTALSPTAGAPATAPVTAEEEEDVEAEGMSGTEIALIGVGGAAVLGALIYLVVSK